MSVDTELASPKKSAFVLKRRSIVNALKKGEGTKKEIADRFAVCDRTVGNIAKKISDGADPIADKRFENTGRPSGVTDEILQFALSYLRFRPKATFPAILREIERRRDEFESHIPTPRQLRYVLNGRLAEITQGLRNGQKEFYEDHAIVVRKEYHRVNEIWQIDCTEADIWALDVRDGCTLFKPWLVSIIDVCSRTIPYLLVLDHSPTSADILLALRTAILPSGEPLHPYYGLPETLSVDNASNFLSAETSDALNRLGITLDNIPIKAPMAHGIVERLFRTIQGDLLASLEGYTKQPHGLKKARKHGAIPYPVLQRIVDRWIAEYHLRDHRTLKCSPFEKWHQGLETAIGLAVDRKTVFAAMKTREDVFVDRDGILTKDGRHLNAKFLTHFVRKTITLRKPLIPGESQIEAYDGRKRLGIVTPIEGDDVTAASIASERLRSYKDIERLRKRLTKSLKRVPPIVTEAMLPVDPAKAPPAPKVGKTRRSSKADDESIPDLSVEPE